MLRVCVITGKNFTCPKYIQLKVEAIDGKICLEIIQIIYLIYVGAKMFQV